MTGRPATRQLAIAGGFGRGSLGNDATAIALIEQLKAKAPDWQLALLVDQETTASTLFGLPVIPVVPSGGWLPTSGPLAPLASKLLRKARSGRALWQAVQSVDGVIIAGGGMFEADVYSGWPAILSAANVLLVAIASRWRGGHLAMVAVGGSYPRDPLERRLFRLAFRRSEFTSFRDEPSKQAALRLGAPVANSLVVDDLVFGIPPRVTARPATKRLGIGMMQFEWLQAAAGHSGPAYTRYREAIANLADEAAAVGFTIVIFGGDSADSSITTWLADELAARGHSTDRILAPENSDFDDLLDTVRKCSVVVASRYHNIIASLLRGVPVVALADRSKVRTIIDNFGLRDQRFEAKDFSPSEVLAAVQRSEHQRSEIGHDIVCHATSAHHRVGLGIDAFVEFLDSWQRPKSERRENEYRPSS